MAGTFWYNATVPLVFSNSCPYFSLSLSHLLFFSLGAFVDTYCLRLPSVSILVFLVLSKLYPWLSPHCYSSLSLLREEWISWPPLFLQLFCLCSRLLARLSLAVLVSAPCALGEKPIVRYIPLASFSTTFPAYLPTCLHLVSLSSLHYRASFRVCSIWDGEGSVSPRSFFPYLFL